MPRPCAVEAHARSQKKVRRFADATALRREGSRSQLKKVRRFADATALRRGIFESWCFFCSRERETPRREAMASVCSEPQNRWTCDTLSGFYETC